MNEAKIQFSPEELILAANADLILTKNRIISKIRDLFGSLAKEMETTLSQVSLPKEIKQTTAKISKGENYRGLPYVVLDYPRLFTKENVFAIRVLFWWANYFSITLHLKGIYKDFFLEKIKKGVPVFLENNFYVNVSADEWQHALHEDDYVLLKVQDASMLQKNFDENNFLKLSAKVELNQWNQSEEKLLNLFGIIINNVKM
jgi:hypothetical protein